MLHQSNLMETKINDDGWQFIDSKSKLRANRKVNRVALGLSKKTLRVGNSKYPSQEEINKCVIQLRQSEFFVELLHELRCVINSLSNRESCSRIIVDNPLCSTFKSESLNIHPIFAKNNESVNGKGDLLNDVFDNVSSRAPMNELNLKKSSCVANIPAYQQQSIALCCYGLGTSSNDSSLLQLCLASLIRCELNIPIELTWVSDPAMESIDWDIVQSLGLRPDKSEHQKLVLSHQDSYQVKLKVELNNPEDISSEKMILENNFIKGHQNYLNHQRFLSIDQHINNTNCKNDLIQQENTKTMIAKKPSTFFVSISQDITQRLSREKIIVLLFMPHCEKPLYGEIFRLLESLDTEDKASSVQLCPKIFRRCVLLGNDLLQYDKFNAEIFYRDNPNYNSKHSRAAAYLNEILPFAHPKYRVPTFPCCPYAFNDMQMTIFSD